MAHGFEYEVVERGPVGVPGVDARARLLTRTYTHLLGALMGFTLIEGVLFATGAAEGITQALVRGGQVGWLLVLGGFMVVGWLARSTAHSAKSPAAQYAALVGYVAVQALIFVPILWIADRYAPGTIRSAALVTIVGFSGLSAIAITTRKDFSFLGGVLKWGGLCALLLIVAGAIFGFQLGTVFSVAMVALAGGAILYDTSNILRTYPEDRHVAASLELFASIALMFWYVLRIFLDARR
jgi:FtsH-binding integral membrane protein